MGLREMLASERDEILRRFEERFRDESAHNQGMTASAIRNDLPRFLDRVAAALGATDSSRTPGGTPEYAGGRHGEQRQGLGIDVKALVLEYGILRDIVLELLIERKQSVDLHELRTWSGHISQAASEAVSRYQQERDHELMTSHAHELAFLAHELRNQVTIGVATVAWVRRKPEHLATALITLDDSLRTMTQMLEREILSDRLRVVQAGAGLHLEEVDLRQLADDVCASYATIAAGRAVTVSVHGERGRVPADPRLLRSSVSNLVSNAIKFSRDGGRVDVRVQRAETLVSLEVEDECGGLSPDAVARIATPWLQLGPDRSGFGLGVAIAKQAAEAHGGTLYVRNVPGRGCVFRLEMPMRRPEAS